MSEATDVVDRQIAAFRNRDLERFLGFYAADVKVRDFDGNVLMDGLEAMRGQYGPLFRDSLELQVELPRRMVAGDHVIDEEDISGFILAGFPPAMHAVVVYRVRDGLIHDVVTCGPPSTKLAKRSSVSTGAYGSTRTRRSTRFPSVPPATCHGGRAPT